MLGALTTFTMQISTELLKKVQNTAKQYSSTWLHKFTTNVCVAVFHARLSCTTVVDAYTFVVGAKNVDLTFRSYDLGHNSYFSAFVC